MENRYQVFVSSTYQDLQEERQEIIQALLELDCIPAGMELFPAADEDQWTLITGVIDDCDYYVVVVAGRYGSVGPDGMSYTEKEYRYALQKEKPIIAFLHKNPGKIPADRTEQTDEGKHQLDEFRKLIQKKLIKHWESPAELGSVVSRSLVKLIRSRPQVGWVRGDQVPDEGAAQEILRLKREVERLEREMSQSRIQAPPGTEDLEQGDDTIKITYYFVVRDDNLKRIQYDDDIDMSWNDIFSSVSPNMIDEASEENFRNTISQVIRNALYSRLIQSPELEGRKLVNFSVFDHDFQTIKVQLRALGLIDKSVKSRSVKDTGTYWTLTPYGDNVMNKLRAIRKKDLLSEP